MIIERDFPDFPFKGDFYTVKIDKPYDGDLIDSDGYIEDELVYSTECDIQKASGSFNSGVITARYQIYFPFDKKEGILVRRGMMFKSNMYGMPVSGLVDEVIPTQFGLAEVHLKDFDT